MLSWFCDFYPILLEPIFIEDWNWRIRGTRGQCCGFTPPLQGAQEGEGTPISKPSEGDRKEPLHWDWMQVPTRRGGWSLAPGWMLAEWQKHRATLMGVRECLERRYLWTYRLMPSSWLEHSEDRSPSWGWWWGRERGQQCMPYPPYLARSGCVIFFQSSEYPGRKSCLEYPKGTKFKGMASQFQGTPLVRGHWLNSYGQWLRVKQRLTSSQTGGQAEHALDIPGYWAAKHPRGASWRTHICP